MWCKPRLVLLLWKQASEPIPCAHDYFCKRSFGWKPKLQMLTLFTSPIRFRLSKFSWRPMTPPKSLVICIKSKLVHSKLHLERKLHEYVHLFSLTNSSSILHGSRIISFVLQKQASQQVFHCVLT